MLDVISTNQWKQSKTVIVSFNIIAAFFSRLGLNFSLSAPSLIAAARKKSGLYHFSDETFMPGLIKLTDDMNRSAHLSHLGRLLMRRRMIDALVTRLETDDLLKKHPEILNQTLPDIWIIGSLPRTGTTMLQRLLASDPATRPTLTWETLFPISPKSGKKDWRKFKTKLLEKLLHYLSPEICAIHPIFHDAPEEDIVIMQPSFLSQNPELVMNVPNYKNWLESTDKTSAYEHLRKVLMILQWQQPQKRWLLKNPFHMEDLDTLMKVFPEAKVIFIHRDPSKIVASFCSLVAHNTLLLSNKIDIKRIGQQWKNKYLRLINRSMAFRETLNPDQFIDIAYADLMKEPFTEVEKIYKKFDAPFTPAAKACMQTHRQHNTQHKNGRHHYQLDDFGLSDAEITEEFAHYCKQYNIPRER